MAVNVFCRSGVESILHLSSVDHFSAFSVSFNRGGRDDAEAGTTCNDDGPGRHTVIIIRVHHHLNQADWLVSLCTALHRLPHRIVCMSLHCGWGASQIRRSAFVRAELSGVSCEPRLLDRPRWQQHHCQGANNLFLFIHIFIFKCISLFLRQIANRSTGAVKASSRFCP